MRAGLKRALKVSPLLLFVLGLFIIFAVDKQTKLESHTYIMWLFDYGLGFMRRALVGETLRIFAGQKISLGLVGMISHTIFVFIALGFAVCVAQIRDVRTAAIIAVVAAFSPLALKNLYFDYGRFDSIIILYSVAFILACRWFSLAAIMLILAPTLLLIHEIALFICLPLVWIAFILSFGTSRRRVALILVCVSIALAGITVLALLIYGKMPVPYEIYGKYLSTRTDLPIETLGTAHFWTSAGFSEAMPIAWKRIYNRSFAVHAILFLPTVAFLFRLSEHLFPGRWVRFGPLIGALHVAPLYFLAMDWGRWSSLLIVVALLYVLAALLAVSRDQIPAGRDLRTFPLIRLDTLFVAWSFLLPAYGIGNPMFKLE